MNQQIYTTQLPEKCWLFEKKHYILRGLESFSLPTVDIKYEELLKTNGIPCRKTMTNYRCAENYEIIEYWDPDFYEEEEISLPLYVKAFNEYRYSGKSYTKKFPTEECVKHARNVILQVNKLINEYEEEQNTLLVYNLAKEKLADGIVGFSSFDFYNKLKSIYEIKTNDDHFIILPVPSVFDVIYTNWAAIFNMNRIVPNGYLTLQVPKHIAGLVIGKHGSNITDWTSTIGVKQINVVPVE